MIACSTHLAESLAFAAPPLLLVASLGAITARARRRRDEPDEDELAPTA